VRQCKGAPKPPGSLGDTRVSPFHLQIVIAYKRNKVKLDPFHMCFTISL
jgi:hypothetical protein